MIPTYEEVVEINKKELQNYCREFNIKFTTRDKIDDLRTKLIRELDLIPEHKKNTHNGQSTHTTSSSDNFPVPSNGPTAGLENNPNTKAYTFDFEEFSERVQETKQKIGKISEQKELEDHYTPQDKNNDLKEINQFSSNEQKSPKYILPVTIDELVQFWQRGFICHPRNLAALAEISSGYHNNSELTGLRNIDLKKRYSIRTGVFLELEESYLKEDEIIDEKWLAPLNIIKSILVDNIENKEVVIRALVNSNKGFSAGEIPITVIAKGSLEGEVGSFEQDPFDLNSKILENFSFINSFMGGFAISSFFEKRLFIEGRLREKTISSQGSFFDFIFQGGGHTDHSNNKLIKFFTERIKDQIQSPHAVQKLQVNKLLENIRKREKESLEEYVYNSQRKESKISPAELAQFHLCLSENLLRDAINSVPTRNPRDPFLLFFAFLNQYPNTATPASSDRQSFLFALADLEKDGVLSAEEAVILAFLLGSYIGYGLCFDPQVQTKDYEWENNEWSFLKILYGGKEQAHIMKKIIGFTDLRWLTIPQENRTNEFELNIRSNKLENRALIISRETLKIQDTDHSKFCSWERSRNGLLLHQFIFSRKDPSIENSLNAMYKYNTRPQELYKEVEQRLLSGEFSRTERDVISALLQLD